MARIDPKRLRAEWDALSRKDPYSVYQWKKTEQISYTEEIAGFILAEHAAGRFDLNMSGVRDGRFRQDGHHGQCRVENGKVNEERYTRALFNYSQDLKQTDRPLGILGKAIDYEVPLAAIQKARKGDIDLLCLAEDTLFVVEVKSPAASTSPLKAVLQAYVGAHLAIGRRKPFLQDYGMTGTVRTIAPAVLLFECSKTYQQLVTKLVRSETFVRLLAQLNRSLADAGSTAMQFFSIESEAARHADCLDWPPLAGSTGHKPVFKSSYVPRIRAQPNLTPSS